MGKYERIKLFILIFTLSLISLIVIMINGKTFDLNININDNVKNIEDMEIATGSDNVIKITQKNYSNGILHLKIKSNHKGCSFVEVSSKGHYSINRIFVHEFGIITLDRRLGKCTGDIVVPISILIIITYLLSIKIKHYKKNIEYSSYQYSNISSLGLILFLSSMLVNQIIQISRYNGFAHSIDFLLESVDVFSKNMFPIVILNFILVTVSHFKLLKKEGITWKNMLGVILGFAIIIPSVFPNLVYSFFNNLLHLSLYNEKSIYYHIYLLLKLFSYSIVSYFECILISTVILAYKSATRIPKFDKDYIIILGCMIKKDGTLTPILKNRADRAIEFAKMQREANGKDIIFVPSGGKGMDEIISEGEAIKNYLLEQGISEDKILVENKSKNTYQNIKFSNELIKKRNSNSNIAFSTTNYHVFRAGIIATKQNVKVEGIGAKTKSYFWINAFIREFIATLYSEKKKIIKVFVLITIISMIIVSLSFISAI